MDATRDVLLAIIGLLLLFRVIQAELEHRALIRLWNDLATMLGDAIDAWLERMDK